MDMSFKKLRNIHRMESQTSKLCKLEPDFYENLKMFLKEESKKLYDYMERMDLAGIHRIANIKKISSEIIAIRKRKILALATEESDPENLVGWEKELFKEIKQAISKYSVLPEDEEREKTVKVKFLDNIPRFIGTDYKEYGPYKKGDTAEIPKDVAEILIMRNLAERWSHDTDAEVEVSKDKMQEMRQREDSI